MPEPKGNESQNDFISRCVSIVMNEGKDQDEALGKCYGIWRQHKKKSLITQGLQLLKILKSKCRKK
jgi:hypothetical protein